MKKYEINKVAEKIAFLNKQLRNGIKNINHLKKYRHNLILFTFILSILIIINIIMLLVNIYYSTSGPFLILFVVFCGIVAPSFAIGVHFQSILNLKREIEEETRKINSMNY